MRTFSSLLLILTLVAVTMAGCDAFSNDDGGVVVLNGTVVNSITRVGIEDVLVQVSISDSIAFTNTLGEYSLEFDVDSTQEITLGFSKSGFISTSTTVTVVPDRTIEVAPQLMAEVDNGNDPDDDDPLIRESGRASNILLFSQSSSSIGVRESGSVEVAELIFQATDSLGRPITPENAATINFSFGANPGGEAFIFPESVTTDENGRAKTNISSGTIAGVVQVIATATEGTRVIRSRPVALAIHGGLPDEDHFGVVSEVLNVARAWDFFGIENGITAFIGDQYSNPVRPGTVAYFSTSAGIIEGSSTTDELGRAGVTIISGPPRPEDHPLYGPGYVTVTANTADRFNNEITDNVVLLFSGSSNIVFPNGQGALDLGITYTYFVYDQNMNPLAAGTNITVTAEGTNVEAVGNTNVQLTDNLFGDHNFESQGLTYGTTRFTFGIAQGEDVDANDQPIEPEIEAVTIRVNSPNGNIERVIFANGGIFERDETGELIPVID